MTQSHEEESLTYHILFMMASSYSGDGSGPMVANDMPGAGTFCLHCASRKYGVSESILDLEDAFCRWMLILFRVPNETAIELLAEQFRIDRSDRKIVLGKCMPVREFVQFVIRSVSAHA